jgi:hypothetical protein
MQSTEQFFTRPDIIVDGMADQLNRVKDYVNNCNSLRNREIDKVAAYLNSFE